MEMTLWSNDDVLSDSWVLHRRFCHDSSMSILYKYLLMLECNLLFSTFMKWMLILVWYCRTSLPSSYTLRHQLEYVYRKQQTSLGCWYTHRVCQRRSHWEVMGNSLRHSTLMLATQVRITAWTLNIFQWKKNVMKCLLQWKMNGNKRWMKCEVK